jgi:potassium efflux system protein
MAGLVDQAEADLHAVTSGLRTQALDDHELKARIAAIPPIQAKLANALSALEPRLQDADARLAQLGPAPSPGQPAEDPEIANNRRNLGRFRQAVDTEVKQARLLSVEADQVSDDLATRLTKNFTTRLWAQSRSALDPALWAEFASAFPNDIGRLPTAFTSERQQFGADGRTGERLLAMGLAVLAALLLVGPARVALNRLGYRIAPKLAPESRLRRSALALWLVLVAALTPLLAGLMIRGVLSSTGAITPTFDRLLILVIKVTVFAAALEGLGRALLSPGRPSWRMAPLPDAIVARLAPFPWLIGVTAALASLIAGLDTTLGSSAATSAAADCLAVLVQLAALGGALAMTGRARTAHVASPELSAPHHGESSWPWVGAVLIAWLALIAALLSAISGYLTMASFLTREIIWIAAVLAMLFLLLRFVDDLFPALLSPASAVGRLVRGAVSLSDHALEQIGVLLSGLFRLLLLIFSWSAILAPFGASVDDVLARVTSTSLVITLGKVSISPGVVLGGAAVLALGLFATRAVRGWLEQRYLPKTRMDVGVRTSIAAAVTYLGALVAILAACAYLGVSLDRLALLASALSVGIGFGLQSIIGNFVSGLILLAERPVKVGDWIAIGEMEGDVKRINIRATEIEMMDKSKLIVPNSDLISKTVRNVTHSGALGRVKIVLRTEHEADPGLVRELLLARLQGHPEVLSEPAAAVYLTDVRDGGLEFTALAYVASARQAYRVKSELLFQIVPDLKGKGVALANTTPVVNVGLTDRPIEPALAAVPSSR